MPLTEVHDIKLRDCTPRTDWFGLAVGLALTGIGIVLTVTVWGAIIGLPVMAAAVALLTLGEVALG